MDNQGLILYLHHLYLLNTKPCRKYANIPFTFSSRLPPVQELSFEIVSQTMAL